MVPVKKLIELFQKMYREHWKYEWGKAEEGCVDCSGAFVYAFRQFGISFPHGSNAIARKYTVGGLLPVSQAKPGMVAFKAHPPGEKGYNLPEKYKSSGDLNDYYHVGLVDDDPAFVLNAKGTSYGFCRDKISSGWDCVAYLKNVDYEEEKPVNATVVLPSGANGSTVNLRKSASTASEILAKVPVGALVRVLDDQGTWCNIRYGRWEGWMMSNYLEYVDQGGESEGGISEVERSRINNALRNIEEAAALISSIIGRG